MHPVLVHARSSNLVSTAAINSHAERIEGVRFMCHPGVSLRSNMDYSKNLRDLTLLEVSHVCGMTNTSWKEWCAYVAWSSSVDANTNNINDDGNVSEVNIKPENNLELLKTYKVIDDCLRDLRNITPQSVLRFTTSRKRRQEELQDDDEDEDDDVYHCSQHECTTILTECGNEISTPGNVNSADQGTAFNLESVLGFSDFKCSRK